MKPLTNIIRCIPLWILLFISCNKEKLLPPATQTGANTFGCLVDGKAWIPTGSSSLFVSINPTSGGFYRNVDRSLNIYIRAYGDKERMHIFLKHATTPGTYYLNQTTDAMPGAIFPESYGLFSNRDPQGEFITDAQHTGVVNITYADTSKKIVSGNFEMTVFQKSTGKTKRITKGRFDYKTH
ncbi:MAG TPA: DUF6252 family protein [Flavisolibacter sp.]|nr:DUF6252 family protein [Flavisolibacter sp.]